MFYPVGVALFATLSQASPLAVDGIYADGQDRWTLFDRKLSDRNLFEQLADDRQKTRLAKDFSPYVTGASDSQIGAQVGLENGQLSRFHGYFIFDTYMSARPIPQLDVNLNLLLFNPSASDGDRVSAQAIPAGCVHLHLPLFDIAGSPLRLDFIAPDLDLVTIGEGLLVEQAPLEGYAGSLRWQDFELRELFSGRTYWDDDDLQSLTLSAFDRRLGLMWSSWLIQSTGQLLPQTDVITQSGVGSPDIISRIQSGANYLGAFGEISPIPTVRLAGEYQARIDRRPIKSAAMIRTDYLGTFGALSVHAGYQFRYYQMAFGPRDLMITPSTVPALPFRELAYATSSFELFGLSRYFDQWSHTLMVEARYQLTSYLFALGDMEAWWKAATDNGSGESMVVYQSQFGRAPGVNFVFYYQVGLEGRPWQDLPHRIRLIVTNKTIASQFYAVQEETRRFDRFPVLMLTGEVFL